MSQKRKGKMLDSSPKLGKQHWKRANMKGSRRKLLVDRLVEVLQSACTSSVPREDGDEVGSTRLENKPAVHCPSAQADGYSENWRALSKQLGIEASRKKQRAGTSPEYDYGNSTVPRGMDVFSMATTSKSRQFQRRRTKSSSLRKKRDIIRRTPVESVKLKPKGGPNVRGEDIVTHPRKRPLQTAKGAIVAVHQGAHFTVDPRESLTEPGEHVAEECKKEHGRSKLQGGKKDQVQVRKHKVPSRERTEVQRIEPVRSEGKKLQREAVGRRTALKKKDIWFDDVELEMVDGEPVPKRPRVESTRVPLVTGSDKSAGKCIALDCEMVGTGPTGDFSMLARCSIVNHHGNTLYDKYVAPMDVITDYRTAYSGIRPRDLEGAPDFKTVQREVSNLIRGRILVGHGLHHDLKAAGRNWSLMMYEMTALLLSHPKRDIRDTSRYKPFRMVSKGGTPSLKKLAWEILGINIQEREHNSVEDARVAMRLYQLHRQSWEATLKARIDPRRKHLKTTNSKKRQVTEQEDVKQHAFSKPFNVMLHSD